MAAKAGHAVGATTIGAAGGGGVGAGLGAAIADVLVELVPRLEPVELSVGIILAAVLAYLGGILGGKFSPSSTKNEGGAASTPPAGDAGEPFLVTGPDAVQVGETASGEEPSVSPTPDLGELEPGATSPAGELEDPEELPEPVAPDRGSSAV